MLSANFVLAVAFSSGTACGQTASAVSVPPSQPVSGPKVVVSNLEAACRPEAVQAVAAKLPTGVNVKEIDDGPKLPGGAKFTAANENRQAYCQVTGSFVTDPQTGKTANFLATFPATWNSKYLQLGCGGHCGTFAVSDAASGPITITNQGLAGQIIIKGYASIATDEGHETMTGGDWAVKGPGQIDQAIVDDFLYRSHKMLSHAGKELTAAFYTQATGKPQKLTRSYFSGCSGGGRDALVAASFMPEEFDGIIAGSPYADMVGVAFQSAGGTLANVRSDAADIPVELVSKIDPFVKAKCDEADGIKDGLIQNPAACDFIPSRDLPLCDGKAPADACFTKAQIESISTVVSAVTDELGNLVQPGYSISEVQYSMRKPTEKDIAKLPAAMKPMAGSGQGAMTSLADAVMKIFVHQNDPNYDLTSLIKFAEGGSGKITNFHIIAPQADVAKGRTAMSLGIGAHPERIGALIKQNHKLIIWANLSDQLLTPYMSINYYKTLAKMYGGYTKLQNNVRLFLLPGTAHCSMSGCGPTSFDVLSAMEDWVENGNSPDTLIATQYATKPHTNPMMPTVFDYSKTVRTMPLCKFPEMAHYSGQGDVMDAANWSCPASDTSMLKVGESGRQAGVIE